MVVGSDSAALHEPRFSGNEWKYLKECLDSTFVSSVGKFVDRFESDLSDYLRAKHVIAVINGTSALHVALILSGVKNNDEVLIPALTFVATANSVNYCGAIPHFVDSEENCFGIDPYALRKYLSSTSIVSNGDCVNKKTGRTIRAIVPMHVFGHPVDIDEILGVAKDFHLTVIEDATESLGSTYNGNHTGTFGTMGALSFNGNKTITTGSGGAIVTNDDQLAKQAKHITTTAKVPHLWKSAHDKVGFNYRMANINAALGCAQLEQLDTLIAAKRNLYNTYKQAFADFSDIRIISEPTGCRSNYWLQTLLLSEKVSEQRDNILNTTNNMGLMTRPVWTLLPHLSQFQNCPSMELPIASSLEKRIINVPSSAKFEMLEDK